ncbi:MAG: PAS domain S-box protein, partial [Methanobacterium sp.]
MKEENEIREKAEKRIEKTGKAVYIHESKAELVHELQVHYAELEMQNDELKKSQIELSNLYEHFHELYNEAPVGYFSLDKKGNIRDVNIKGAELLGLEKDMIIGFGFIRYIPSEYQYKFHRAIDDAVVMHKIQKVELQLKNDKSPFYVIMQIMPIQDKPDERYRIIITDITERKKAEKALQESEQRFSLMANCSPVLIWVNGPEGCQFVNNGYMEFVGVDKDVEVCGFNWEQFVHPDDREAYINNYNKAYAEKGIFKGQYRFRRHDGEYRWMKYIAAPRFTPEGEFVGYVGSSIDINDIKQMEGELMDSQHDLEGMNVELTHSNEELEQFAYVASHDMQEPLRTIASFTQLLERRYKGKLDENADEFMDYIVEAAKRMQTLINDLLLYSRITTKGKELEPVNVNEVVDNVLSNLKNSIDENNAEIKIDKLPTVMADESQLVQLFQNLIGNAIKFKKPDKPPKIHISAQNNNKYLFSVSDNGIGMEQQYKERIFEIFQRLHTRDVYKGTG